MKNFHINQLAEQEFSALVVMCNSEYPLLYFDEIEQKLRKQSIEGRILIDQILHVGNTSERFFSFCMIDGKIENCSMRVEKIEKDSCYRKASCQFLYKSDLIEYSILSSIQKKMLNRGITI